MTLGLIAGNGRFPFLLLDAARAEGLEVVVAAIKEETDPEIDRRAESDSGVTCALAFAGRALPADRDL
jgi:UDP-2,3-diacylglucosamine hydrolase